MPFDPSYNPRLFGLPGNKGQVAAGFCLLAPMVGVLLLWGVLFTPPGITPLQGLDAGDLAVIAPLLVVIGVVLSGMLALWLSHVSLRRMVALIGMGYAWMTVLALWMTH